jgi:[protein-PII] uridylyltransferase
LPFARDLLTRAASRPEFGEALRRSPAAATEFVALVSTPRKAAFRGGSILAELHDTGLLTAMIPEFLPVVGRVHHDVYHVFTVDVHSVAAVDFLRALARGEFSEEHPLASSLAKGVPNSPILYLSTLLHDIGKDLGGRDHSRRGADLAALIFARLGLSPGDIDDACSLILQHLTMYRAAARRDLEDPATISEFAESVHGREGLRHLFLLTVADLSTTSPTSMTKWKRHMLDGLFRATDELLSRPTSTRSVDEDAVDEAKRLLAVRAAVRTRWSSSDDATFLDDYLASMPHGYLLSNGPAEIAWHARVALHAQESVVTAELVTSQGQDVASLCVVTGHPVGAPLCVVAKDRPGLLASIAAAITASGFDIHAAQVHSRQCPEERIQAVDLFWVTSRDRIEDLDEALPALRSRLERVITGSVAATDLVKNARRTRFSDRPIPAVPTEVTVDNGVSATHTVVEIVTKDRPGLLFTLAKAFHELDLTISVAKINTEGTRALDVFYVTDVNGNKVEGPFRGDHVRGAVLSALSATPRPGQSASAP